MFRNTRQCRIRPVRSNAFKPVPVPPPGPAASRVAAARLRRGAPAAGPRGPGAGRRHPGRPASSRPPTCGEPRLAGRGHLGKEA